jgi:methyl-accepting chemotaxis protein/purine-cytosine permease-like protein
MNTTIEPSGGLHTASPSFTAAPYKHRFKAPFQETGPGCTTIWVSSFFCLPMFMIGGILQQGLSLGAVALCGLAGFGLVGVYACLIGMQSSDTRISIHSAAAVAMGSIAAQVITSMLIAIACIGWFSIQAATLGASFSAEWNALTGMSLPPGVSTLIWGSITAVIATSGFRWMKYFSYVSLPVCVVLLLYLVFSVDGDMEAAFAYRPSAPMPAASAIATAVGACALGGVLCGDYFRHCKTRTQIAVTCALTVLAQSALLWIGALLLTLTGQWNPTAVLAQKGHPLLGLVYLVFSSIAINLTNAYSGRIAVSMMLGVDERRFKITSTLACGIGIALGALGVMSLFTVFLSAVSSLIPPVAGVVIGSYWVKGKGSEKVFSATLERDIYVPGVAAFILGALTTFLTGTVAPFFIPPVNGLIVSLIAYCLLDQVMEPAEAARNLRLASKFIGGFILCAIITIATGGLGLSAIRTLTTPENAAISNDLTTMTVMLMLVGIALSLGLGFMFAGLIVNPIRHAFGLLKTIATGDLTGTIDSASNDEIGEMMRVLKQTQEGISGLVLAIQAKAESLERVGGELAVMMDQSASTVQRINANAEGMKEKALVQAEKVYEVMSGMAGNIQALDTHIAEQSESVIRSSSSIEMLLSNIGSITSDLMENQRNVSGLSRAAAKGSKSVEEVAGAIQQAVAESERLLEINQVIQRIASKTNLLSMNAAIEAAHAGNAGMGFAVVAEEIRQLAESSSAQAKTISSVLKEIKSRLERIGGSAQTVLQSFEDIDAAIHTVSTLEDRIQQAMARQHAGSQDILEAISQSQKITHSVRTGSQAMVSTSKQVIEESKKALTAELGDSMNEIATGMEQINAATHRTKNISAENRQHIEALARELSQFRTPPPPL